MSFVELQVPPQAILEIFEAKSVASGMSRAVPGGATVTLGGVEKDTYGAVSLVPVVVTLRPDGAIDLFSSWLCEKLKRMHVRQVRIKGFEIEVSAEGIARAISERIEIERELMVSDDRVSEKHSTQQLPMTPISEEEIVSSKGVIICLRVPSDIDTERYVQGSAIQKCSVCQSKVLVAPSTQVILAEGENQIVCMECWTEAQAPEISPEVRENKLRQLKSCEQAGEQAYDDMYEKAHNPSDTAVCYSDAKEYFYTAIGLARELGLEQKVERLENRLAHIKSVFRSQFS